MKPEELKVIAEGMGYKSTIADNKAHYRKLMDICWFEYNPLTNDTQMKEIMEKLLNEGNSCSICKLNKRFAVYKNEKWTDGKTINEAVCKAALEYFKGNRQ